MQTYKPILLIIEIKLILFVSLSFLQFFINEHMTATILWKIFNISCTNGTSLFLIWWGMITHGQIALNWSWVCILLGVALRTTCWTANYSIWISRILHSIWWNLWSIWFTQSLLREILMLLYLLRSTIKRLVVVLKSLVLSCLLLSLKVEVEFIHNIECDNFEIVLIALQNGLRLLSFCIHFYNFYLFTIILWLLIAPLTILNIISK
jgi:hypothetical protein